MGSLTSSNNNLLNGSEIRHEGSIEKLLNAGRPRNSNAEDVAKKGKLVIPRKNNPIAPTKAIYCIGDATKILRYDVLSDRWSTLE